MDWILFVALFRGKPLGPFILSVYLILSVINVKGPLLFYYTILAESIVYTVQFMLTSPNTCITSLWKLCWSSGFCTSFFSVVHYCILWLINYAVKDCMKQFPLFKTFKMIYLEKIFLFYIILIEKYRRDNSFKDFSFFPLLIVSLLFPYMFHILLF